MKQNVLIIAGEKSGEDHAMTFFPSLKEKLPNANFFGVGGPELKALDVELIYNLKDFSSMGFTEVLGKIPFYLRAMKKILKEVEARNCKTAILVDFQGFNLKIAKKLKSLGVDVLYYVAPQAWVWKPWRAKVLEENVHTLFTILPFEKKWFQERGVSKVKAVVHPLMIKYSEETKNIIHRSFESLKDKTKKILVLPGSRNSEVSVLLPIFLDTAKLLRESGLDIELSIVKVNSVSEEFYKKYESEFIKVYDANSLSDAINESDFCLASSGTVTLATGIFELPTVVAYKMSWLNVLIVNMLIPYKGPASLTNIILGEYVFPEFLQGEVSASNLSKISLRFLTDGEYYDSTVNKLKKTKNLLSGDDFDVTEYMVNVISNNL